MSLLTSRGFIPVFPRVRPAPPSSSSGGAARSEVNTSINLVFNSSRMAPFTSVTFPFSSLLYTRWSSTDKVSRRSCIRQTLPGFLSPIASTLPLCIPWPVYTSYYTIISLFCRPLSIPFLRHPLHHSFPVRTSYNTVRNPAALYPYHGLQPPSFSP